MSSTEVFTPLPFFEVRFLPRVSVPFIPSLVVVLDLSSLGFLPGVVTCVSSCVLFLIAASTINFAASTLFAPSLAVSSLGACTFHCPLETFVRVYPLYTLAFLSFLLLVVG